MTQTRGNGGLWRWARRFAIVLAVLIALPLVLTLAYNVVPPVSVPMLWRAVTGQPVAREWRDLDQISDRLKASVVMSEDGQFCRHWGVDVSALRAEVEAALAGQEARGASTITMQVARNLFLWNDRSYVRKALEIPLAVYIDLVMPKRRILEIYLNIAEWGPEGQFGIEAGAQAAFGKDADAFTWTEASLMAASLPNPIVRRPGQAGPGLSRVARIVEGRARQGGSRIGCLYQGQVPSLD